MTAMPAPWQASLSQSASPAAAPSATSQTPIRVTTDTPEYCWSLAHRIDDEQHGQTPAAQAAAGPAASSAKAMGQEVGQLVVEGRRMCGQGLVLGGIARLRRAWTLLHPGE